LNAARRKARWNMLVQNRLKLAVFIILLLIFLFLRGRHQDYAYYILVWFIFIYALVAGGRELYRNLHRWERKFVFIHGFVLVLVFVALIIGFLFFLDELPRLAPLLALLGILFAGIIFTYDNEGPGHGESRDDRHQ
jgi:hypothetical protein